MLPLYFHLPPLVERRAWFLRTDDISTWLPLHCSCCLYKDALNYKWRYTCRCHNIYKPAVTFTLHTWVIRQQQHQLLMANCCRRRSRSMAALFLYRSLSASLIRFLAQHNWFEFKRRSNNAKDINDKIIFGEVTAGFSVWWQKKPLMEALRGFYHRNLYAWCLSAAETCGLSEVTALAPVGCATRYAMFSLSTPEVLNLSPSRRKFLPVGSPERCCLDEGEWMSGKTPLGLN